MRIVCVSDTHWHYPSGIPDGDVIVHAGDLSGRGTISEVQVFLDWFAALPHKHKVFIAGNHDWLFQNSPVQARDMVPANVTYLRDSEAVIDGVRFYGSPWQPEFFDWAFNLPRMGKELRVLWSSIPDDTNVLITHGPPHGILDMTDRGEAVGCELLKARVQQLKNLKLHVFGHIHNGYGQTEIEGAKFVNASICTEAYKPLNPAIVVDL